MIMTIRGEKTEANSAGGVDVNAYIELATPVSKCSIVKVTRHTLRYPRHGPVLMTCVRPINRQIAAFPVSPCHYFMLRFPLSITLAYIDGIA